MLGYGAKGQRFKSQLSKPATVKVSALGVVSSWTAFPRFLIFKICRSKQIQ